MKLNAPIKSEPKSAEPPAWKWDAAAVDAKLKDVFAYYESFSGKPGFNPWFFILQTYKPLEARVKAGDTSRELFDSVMALEKKEPTV